MKNKQLYNKFYCIFFILLILSIGIPFPKKVEIIWTAIAIILIIIFLATKDSFKINPEKMQAWADVYYKDKSRSMLQQKYFDLTYENCIKHGFHLDKKENIKFNADKDWATVTIYRELIKDERNRKIGG